MQLVYKVSFYYTLLPTIDNLELIESVKYFSYTIIY